MSDPQPVNARPIEELIGETLGGRFLLVAPQRRGTFGQTYKAVQQPLDRIVAVKVLDRSAVEVAERGFLERFTQEMTLAAKLTQHNTCKLIDFGDHEGLPFVAMEWIDGVMLADHLARVGQLPWETALSLALSICRSLREAHRGGLLHRSLKPANVMVIHEGEPESAKVLDYGLARCFVPDDFAGRLLDLLPPGKLLGAPAYMAPEQALNRIEPRSDVYALGAILYEMLAARPPFTGQTLFELSSAHAATAVPPLLRSDLPDDVVRLVIKCLEKKPEDRFESAEALADALRAILEATSMPHHVITEPHARAPASRDQTAAPVAAESPVPASAPVAVVATLEPAPVVPPRAAATVEQTPASTARTEVMVIGELFGAPAPAPVALFGNIVKNAPDTPPPAPEQSQPLPTLFAGALGERKRKKRSPLPWISAATALVIAAIFFFSHRSPSGAPPAPVATAPVSTATPPAPPPAPEPPKPPPVVHFHVESAPPGAELSVGDKSYGKTPVVIDLPRASDGAASAELTFELDGYSPLTVSVGGAGNDVMVKQTLEKLKPSRKKKLPVAHAPKAGHSHTKIAAAPPAPVRAPEPVVQSPVAKPKPSVVASVPISATPAAAKPATATAPASASSPAPAPAPAATSHAAPPAAAVPAVAASPAPSSGAPVRNVPPFVLDKTLLTRTPPRISESFRAAHPHEQLSGIYKVCVGEDGHIANVVAVKSIAGADSDISQGIREGWAFQPQRSTVCALYSVPIKIE